MKHFLALVLALSLVLALASCGGQVGGGAASGPAESSSIYSGSSAQESSSPNSDSEFPVDSSSSSQLSPLDSFNSFIFHDISFNLPPDSEKVDSKSTDSTLVFQLGEDFFCVSYADVASMADFSCDTLFSLLCKPGGDVLNQSDVASSTLHDGQIEVRQSTYSVSQNSVVTNDSYAGLLVPERSFYVFVLLTRSSSLEDSERRMTDIVQTVSLCE